MKNSDSAWPEGWAFLYDAMDVDRSLHRQFYTGLITPATHRMLDLGCGTGSITLAMAERMAPGSHVTGVDLSPAMIEIARKLAPQHDWLVGDICDPPVLGPFDLVVICFHTLQVLLDEADLARCFQAVAQCLAPDGRFAFDIYQPNPDWLAQIDSGPHLARQFTGSDGVAYDVMEHGASYDAGTAVLSGLWTLHDRASGQQLPLEPIVQRVKQYFPQDIARHLAAAGLIVSERYGELDKAAFTATSKRQVYVCKKG
jgi:SAM-dependent methyltransferase